MKVSQTIFATTLFATGALIAATPREELDRALYLADRGYWAGAASHFVEAEKGFQQAQDPENELYARIGRLRATAEQQRRPLPLIAAEIAHELETNPILVKNARMRMFAFEVKGDIDGESNTSAMREDFEAMNQIAKQLGDQKAENRSLMFLGLTAFYDGDLNMARDNVAKALNVATRIGDKPTQMMCLSILGKGLADTGLPEQGLQMIDRALGVAATIPDAGYQYLTNSFKIGALIGVRRLAEAEGLSNDMLRRATLDSRAVWQVTALTQLAAVYRASERVAQSRTMLLRALEMAKTAELTRLRGEVEGELAAAFLQTGELEHAENHASEAALSTQKAGDLITLPQVLGKLAQIQKLRRNTDSAVRTFERAALMIDANFGRTLNTFDRTSLVRTASDISTNHFSLLAERGADVGTLFRLIETTRARALADLLASSRPRAAEFEGPERHIAKLRLGLMQARTDSQVRTIRDQILNAEQDRWIAPGVSGLGSLKSELSLANLQKRLPPTVLVIEYVLADPASYCIAIARNSARLIRLASGAKLRATSQSLSKSMAAGEQASAASREMFLQLLAPVSEITRYKQIVIVRDGPLHFVPFEALESADGQALVDSVAVTYAPSASALVALMNKKHHLQSARVLAVGGVPYSESGPNQSAFLRGFSNRTFANLPGSVDEVKTAVAVAPDGQRRLLLGREATESAVKAHLPRFGYLHFAVHGVSDKINSERAALILLSDERAGEDGILQSSEIMHLKLTADVVTLSACETSVGTMHGHEGIENLSRAFLIAGARAVVSTLWQVDDQSSAYLMKRFYLHLAAKSPPTFALAEAKRDLRRAFGARATPYQWAGFVLEGGL